MASQQFFVLIAIAALLKSPCFLVLPLHIPVLPLEQ